MSDNTIKVTEQQWGVLTEALELYGRLTMDADNHYADVASNLVLEDFVKQCIKEETTNE